MSFDVRCGGRHLAAVFPRFRHRSTTIVRNNIAHPIRPKYRTASSVALDNSYHELVIGTGHEDGLTSVSRVNSRDQVQVTASDSFLEPEDEEYHRIVLPHRPMKPIVIPWPTILPHPTDTSTASSSSSTAQTPREPVVYLPSSAKFTLAEMKSKRKQGLVITPCQALSKAVLRKDWETADRLLVELEDLGIPIRPEEVYLQGAVQQLRAVVASSSRTSTSTRSGQSVQSSEVDETIRNARSMALRYLAHHPNLPIHLRLSANKRNALQWLFTLAMENNHTTDLEFTERFLRICANKGLLGMTVHTGFFREWCERVETVRGYKVMTELIEIACLTAGSGKGYDGRPGSVSSDEQGKRVALMRLGAELRNVHLRTLIHGATRTMRRSRQVEGQRPGLLVGVEQKSGRDALDLAKSVYVAGTKLGIRWDERTKRAMVHAIRSSDLLSAGAGSSGDLHSGRRGDDRDFAQHLKDAAAKRKRSASGISLEEMSVTALAKETRRIVRGRAHLPLNDLVEVLIQLEHQGDRYSLLGRLRDRFVGPAKFRKILPWAITETTKSFWYMAQVTKLKKQGKLGEAIGTFRKEFLWHGLPNLQDLPMRQPMELEEVDSGRRKLRPTSPAITGVLDAILRNLKPSHSGSVVDLNHRYINVLATSSTGEGQVLMDQAGHLPFILAMIRCDGPQKTQKHLENLEAKGVYLGVPCWTAIATEYAKQGYSRRALAILAAHPILPTVTSAGPPSDPGKTDAISAIKSDRKRGTPRMYAAVAAMHYRIGRVWRAREVIGKMQGQSGPSIRSARRRWIRSRDKASLSSSI